MTQDQLLWVIGLTALLTAPAAVVFYALLRRLWPWASRQLPPRYLVARGWREARGPLDVADEERPHE